MKIRSPVNSLRVIVVDGSQLRAFPKTCALFEAAMEKRLDFSIAIPRSGDYYEVFDNRNSPEPLQVKLIIKPEPAARRRRHETKPGKQEETRDVTKSALPA